MSLNGKDVSQALSAKILAMLSAGGISDKSFLSIVSGGGILVSASDFDFLTDAGSGGNSNDPLSGGKKISGTKLADHQRDMSNLVCRIPETGGAFTASGKNVITEYENWLNTIDVPLRKLTKKNQSVLNSAKKTLDNDRNDYSKYRAQYQNAKSGVWAAEKAGNAIDIAEKKEQEQNCLQDWQDLGNKKGYESALAIKNNYTNQGYQILLQGAKDAYENEKGKNVDTQGGHYVSVNFEPDDFIGADSTAWNTFTFTEQDVSTYVDKSEDQWSAEATIPIEDFFWVGGGTPGDIKSYDQDIKIDGLRLSFEYCRVAIDHSHWLDLDFVQSQAWRYQNATKSDPTGGGVIFSDGNPVTQNKGQWVLTPTEMLLVRNLKVHINSSDDHTTQKITDITVHVEVGFLFFHLGGASYHHHDDKKTHTFTSKNGEFEANSMQILAFVCDIMPKEPNTDFNLFPN